MEAKITYITSYEDIDIVELQEIIRFYVGTRIGIYGGGIYLSMEPIHRLYRGQEVIKFMISYVKNENIVDYTMVYVPMFSNYLGMEQTITLETLAKTICLNSKVKAMLEKQKRAHMFEGRSTLASAPKLPVTDLTPAVRGRYSWPSKHEFIDYERPKVIFNGPVTCLIFSEEIEKKSNSIVNKVMNGASQEEVNNDIKDSIKVIDQAVYRVKRSVDDLEDREKAILDILLRKHLQCTKSQFKKIMDILVNNALEEKPLEKPIAIDPSGSPLKNMALRYINNVISNGDYTIVMFENDYGYFHKEIVKKMPDATNDIEKAIMWAMLKAIVGCSRTKLNNYISELVKKGYDYDNNRKH